MYRQLKYPVVKLMVSTVLPTLANLLNYYNESEEAQPGAYQLGTLVKEPVVEMLHEFRKKYVWKFLKKNDVKSALKKKKERKKPNQNWRRGALSWKWVICSPSNNEEVWLPLDNLEIQAAYTMLYPISQNKIKNKMYSNAISFFLFTLFLYIDIQTVKPLETLASSFWQGVSGQLIAPLLPPFMKVGDMFCRLWKTRSRTISSRRATQWDVPFKEFLKDDCNAKVVFQDLNPTCMVYLVFSFWV